MTQLADTASARTHAPAAPANGQLPPAAGPPPFADRMLGIMNSAALALMISLGHRTRLFDVMSVMPSVGGATSDEIARRARLSERYVREWLGAMVAGGIVIFDERTNRYALPAEHAAFLTRAGSPNNMAATCQWVGLLGSVESLVAEAFVHGKGVPYECYPRFHEVMAEESDQTTLAGLEPHIIPLVPGLRGQLERGIDVLDVGCGRGRAMIHLASIFPRSRFTGWDFSAEAIEAGRAEARERGLSNVTLEVRDASEPGATAAFDLVFTFDAVHDQAKPEAMLANICRALKPGGVYLMQDIGASSCVHCNRSHLLGPFIYTVSCMHCMSVSLAGGGPGLGAAWGRELAARMLKSAGFTSVEIHDLPHDILNCYAVCRA